MAKRRKTPEEDFERLAERMYNQRFAGQISDRETFEKAWKSYFQGGESLKNKKLKENVFRILKDKYDVFKGDVSLERKQLREDVKAIKGEKTAPSKKIKHEFDFVGTERGRVVYARQIKINFMGKQAVRFIDEKGRYVSVRRKP